MGYPCICATASQNEVMSLLCSFQWKLYVCLYILFSEIITTAERTDIAPHVKDGYIMMFIYMPVVFTSEFTPYIGQIINPILKVIFVMSCL